MYIFTLIGAVLEHKANQRLTREAFKQKQLTRFRSFVRYIQCHSSYYAKIIKEHAIDLDTCLPEHFPILTKDALMTHFDEISTEPSVTKEAVTHFFQHSKDPNELFQKRFVAIHSSGTSGEVSYFVYTERDWIRGMAHNYRMSNFRLKKHKVAFYGMTGGHYAGVSFVNTANKSILKRWYEVQEYDVNTPLVAIVERMNAYQPTIIAGYPSSIKKLADMQLSGELRIYPETFQVSGEMLSENDRTLLERAFPSAEVINVYSCSDHMIMGIGKPGYHGIYLMEDRLIFEPLEDGLIVTNLFNYTLPLIRYRMNDRVVPVEDDRERIYPFLKVREIVGRAENSPVFENKHGVRDTITQHMIGEIFVENLKAMQVKALDFQSFLVYFTVDEAADPAAQAIVKDQLDAAWSEILYIKEMDNVSFQTQQVDRLDIDKLTGKFRLIVD
jgi:phenylacetate-CoA ligase